MERATDPCNIKHANESQFTASSQVQRTPWRPQRAFHQLLHSQWSVVFDCDNGKCGAFLRSRKSHYFHRPHEF